MAGESPCLLYAGPTFNSNGYGVLPKEVDGSRLAHRAALAEKLGRPVVGVTRHTCDNPPCIEPSHLLEGSQADNIDDAWQKGRLTGGRGKATHCVHGHEFTPENTAYKAHRSTRSVVNERVCRTCRRRRNAEQAAKRKAARAANRAVSTATHTQEVA